MYERSERDSQPRGADVGAERCALFGKIHLLPGSWQIPLEESARELFTIVIPDGLLMPMHVPQGVLNATGDSRAGVTDISHGLYCIVWVDDIVR